MSRKFIIVCGRVVCIWVMCSLCVLLLLLLRFRYIVVIISRLFFDCYGCGCVLSRKYFYGCMVRLFRLVFMLLW